MRGLRARPMSLLRSDLPLDRDAAGFFLPAIIGFMVFLAALALAGSMGLDNLLARWRSQIDTAFTIELPPIDGESAAAATARHQAVMAALGAEPGVESAMPVSEEEKARLLAPWLGADVQALDLPLPDLIGVATRPGRHQGDNRHPGAGGQARRALPRRLDRRSRPLARRDRGHQPYRAPRGPRPAAADRGRGGADRRLRRPRRACGPSPGDRDPASDRRP